MRRARRSMGLEEAATEVPDDAPPPVFVASAEDDTLLRLRAEELQGTHDRFQLVEDRADPLVNLLLRVVAAAIFFPQTVILPVRLLEAVPNQILGFGLRV